MFSFDFSVWITGLLIGLAGVLAFLVTGMIVDRYRRNRAVGYAPATSELIRVIQDGWTQYGQTGEVGELVRMTRAARRYISIAVGTDLLDAEIAALAILAKDLGESVQGHALEAVVAVEVLCRDDVIDSGRLSQLTSTLTEKLAQLGATIDPGGDRDFDPLVREIRGELVRDR